MRIMLSKAGAAAFAQTANSLTVLKDGIDLLGVRGSGFYTPPWDSIS